MYGWIIFFSVLHLNCFLFKSVNDCIIPLSPTPTFLFSRGDGQHTVIWKILIIRIWLRSLNPWPMIWLRHCTCLSRIFKGSSSMPLQLLLLLLNCIQLLHICQMEQSRSGQISYKRIPDQCPTQVSIPKNQRLVLAPIILVFLGSVRAQSQPMSQISKISIFHQIYLWILDLVTLQFAWVSVKFVCIVRSSLIYHELIYDSKHWTTLKLIIIH